MNHVDGDRKLECLYPLLLNCMNLFDRIPCTVAT